MTMHCIKRLSGIDHYFKRLFWYRLQKALWIDQYPKQLFGIDRYFKCLIGLTTILKGSLGVEHHYKQLFRPLFQTFHIIYHKSDGSVGIYQYIYNFKKAT